MHNCLFLNATQNADTDTVLVQIVLGEIHNFPLSNTTQNTDTDTFLAQRVLVEYSIFYGQIQREVLTQMASQ